MKIILTREEEGASRTNFNLVNYPYLNLGPEDYQYNSGKAGHNAYRSFFGRIMYSWADRYMLQANIRSDGLHVLLMATVGVHFLPLVQVGLFPKNLGSTKAL